MRTPTNVFCIALAASDSTKIINDILYFVVVLITEIPGADWKRIFISLYPFTHYVFHTTMMAASLLTVAIAIERYVEVCHPYKARSLCTMTLAVSTSICILFFSFLISIPYACKYIVSENEMNGTMIDLDLAVTDLWEKGPFAISFTWVHYVLRSLLPLVLLIVFSARIIYSLRSHRLGHSKQRITICILAVIAVFVMCNFPDTIMSTILNTGYYEASYLVRGFREITDFFLLLQTTTNIIIYCTLNRSFIKTSKELIKKCNCCNRRVSSGNKPTEQMPLRRYTVDSLLS
ncbi:unnamed protein product [Mytilus coruscus]|uniref:G-protein coupled receptors family 1 profile domain-containing protein n=1 Tax=Mytilus coruscus TaxID=42192 RepID=A0A6J8D8H7_MYTCO|nr:unnamed protein product [Mytilus coruscus]